MSRLNFCDEVHGSNSQTPCPSRSPVAPDTDHTHRFSEAIVQKEGCGLEARLGPKMETPPREIVGNVHVFLAGCSAKAISMHLAKSYLAKSFEDAWMHADHFVLQLKHCWLRNVNKHTLKAGQGAPGMGHWLYTLPTAPFIKVANGPFKWGLQRRFGLAA